MSVACDWSRSASCFFVALFFSVVFGAVPCFAGPRAKDAGTYYVTFDPPGSTYTWVNGINSSGQVVGTWRDSTDVVHSYVRNTDGSFVEFDPPGATFSEAQSINDSGEITGLASVSGGNVGYYRDAEGNITTFTADGGATTPVWINNGGSIIGQCLGGGFLRTPDGAITVFNAPGAVTTVPQTINASGSISGYYTAYFSNGFIRSPSGRFTTISDLNQRGVGTIAAFLNDEGQVAGAYTEGSLDEDYLRSVDGEYTSFRISGATNAVPYGINDAGAMAGYEIQHSSGVYGGFIRESDGSITVFQAPGAGVGSGEGTKASAINASGTVAGQYYDSNNVGHGFLRY